MWGLISYAQFHSPFSLPRGGHSDNFKNSLPILIFILLFIYKHQWQAVLFCSVFFFIAGVIVNIFYSLFFCRTHYLLNSIISREKENWYIDFNHFMLLQPTNLQYFYLSTDCPFVVSSLFSTENNTAAYIFTFMELLP